MKTYKLKKWYPGLPKGWNKGTVVEINPDSGIVYQGRYSLVTKDQVENNPDFWEEVVVEKDYKILSFIASDGDLSTLRHNDHYVWEYTIPSKCDNGKGATLEDMLTHPDLSDYNIHSVRRLSDGEVFTVGDQMSYSNDNRVRTITSFQINTAGSMRVHGEHKGGRCMYAFADIKKVKPLFTTEDGVDIYKGDRTTSVFKKDLTIHMSNALNNGRSSILLYFSTKEKAEKYIEEHKLRYSIAEVREALKVMTGNAQFQKAKFWDKLDK